jgi:hypothetical protein
MDGFKTTDVWLAAVLLEGRFRVIDVNRQNPRAVTFTFERSGNIEAIVRSYHEGTLRLEPRSLMLSLKDAKHMLYEGAYQKN